mgnify:CR=1 FL=1
MPAGRWLPPAWERGPQDWPAHRHSTHARPKATLSRVCCVHLSEQAVLGIMDNHPLTLRLSATTALLGLKDNPS